MVVSSKKSKPPALLSTYVKYLFAIIAFSSFVSTLYMHSSLANKINESSKQEEEHPYNDSVLDHEAATARTTTNTAASDVEVPVTIAYAVSFIKCGDFQTNSAGLTDASLVLRHSVHNVSARNPASGSRYDYKMYAIVHRQAEKCSDKIRAAGFEVIVVDPPVRPEEIRGEHLRKNVRREWCCGSDEFVKLHAFHLLGDEEIFVHLDVDFAIYRPLDHLFDAMLFDADTERGRSARARIERERDADAWPDRVDAFLTRDWPQAAPNKFPPGFQAGFLVGRRDPKVFDEIVEIVREGNYTEGWGWKYGWGNKGYGGYVGAMAMQGLVAYYYDHVRPNTAVELNQCRHNHMGMDVRYNNPPNFARRYGRKGQCRNASPDDVCEDCMSTEMEKIYSAHYTMCRKPWQCMATGSYDGKRTPGGGRATAIDKRMVDLDHCMDLVRRWHELRADLENQLLELTGDSSVRAGSVGTYREDVFLGHCNDDGNGGYLMLSGKEETFGRMSELYGE